MLFHVHGKFQQNHIEEVKGVYVPVWLFDADAKANIRYKATKVRTWSDRNYIYTENSYYSVIRSGTLGFEKVPADGSSKMDDNLMESIEPYDFSEAVDFQTAYLAGYFADKYDVNAEQSARRVQERMRKSTQDAFSDTVHGYTTVVPEHVSINMANGTTKYALYPVWMLHTTWKNQKYVFVMNGQTGKFVGNLPMDKSAFARWLFGLTAVIGTVAFAVSYLLWLL